MDKAASGLIRREGIGDRTVVRRRLAAMLMLAVVGLCVPQPSHSADDCLSVGGEAAVKACRSELRNDPGNRDIRLALSDAYLSLKRYEEAVAVLREGFEHAPGDDAIKRQLKMAESYLEEQRWIEKQEQRRAASRPGGGTDTKTRLSIIRCNKLKGQAAISACNDGLKHAPGNPDLLFGRGSAWLALDQYGKAIDDFQASLGTAPGNRKAAEKLQLAQSKRKIKVSQCLEGSGQKAMDACDAALLIGAADEFSIRKQQARLLHAMDREKAALRAYQAASRLNPTDMEVRQALAALSPAPKPEKQSTPSKPVSPEKTPPRQAATRTEATAVKASSPKPSAAPPALPKAPAKTVAVVSAAAKKAEQPVPAAKPPANAPTARTAQDTTVSTDPTTTPPQPASTPAVAVAARTDTPDIATAVQPAQPSTVGAANTPRRFSNTPLIPGITH